MRDHANNLSSRSLEQHICILLIIFFFSHTLAGENTITNEHVSIHVNRNDCYWFEAVFIAKAAAYLHLKITSRMLFSQFNFSWTQSRTRDGEISKFTNYTIARPQVIKSMTPERKNKKKYIFIARSAIARRFKTRNKTTNEWNDKSFASVQYAQKKNTKIILFSVFVRLLLLLLRRVTDKSVSFPFLFKFILCEFHTVFYISYYIMYGRKKRRTFNFICASVVWMHNERNEGNSGTVAVILDIFFSVSCVYLFN